MTCYLYFCLIIYIYIYNLHMLQEKWVKGAQWKYGQYKV